jgi:hypothetical protein
MNANLNFDSLFKQLLAAGLSTSRPVRTSTPGIDSIH